MKVEGHHLVKAFGDPPQEVLHGLTLTIEQGEFVALTGKSGSGKSTLLYLLSTLDTPTSGEVILDGTPVSKLGSHEVHALRNLKMGFVFQFHYLLPDLNAIENVLLPAMKAGEETKRKERARYLLNEFGILDKAQRLPGQLSGGEQQRVAIARALIMNPSLVFADEPTGNLDSQNAEIVMNLLKRINREEGSTMVLITHDEDFARQAFRQIQLKDGRIVGQNHPAESMVNSGIEEK
jgi:putative ABC transport system ATP-binding protein/lipoprotein-releasing system ATP-binding protein